MRDTTWIEPEERAYSHRGRQVRKGYARFPDGVVRAFRAGIPDTFFSIPAHARVKGRYIAGFVSIERNEHGMNEQIFTPTGKSRALFESTAKGGAEKNPTIIGHPVVEAGEPPKETTT